MTEPGSLAFHVRSPDGADARVLLLERGGEAAPLQVTEWAAGRFADPGVRYSAGAAEVAERVERWRHDGWSASESFPRILGWLHRSGAR